jgi:hypothetical protein
MLQLALNIWWCALIWMASIQEQALCRCGPVAGVLMERALMMVVSMPVHGVRDYDVREPAYL